MKIKKIFRNIYTGIKALQVLKYLRMQKKGILASRASGDIEAEKQYINSAIQVWGTKFIEACHSTIEIYGKENLPTEGPIVYMSNHQSYVDIVALCSALSTIQFGYVAKKDLAKLPLYGEWIELIRSVMIDRDNPRESLKAISKGISFLKQGFSMLIFPEGTRSKSSTIGEFKKGAMKLATKPGVPIIPVSIEGTYKLYETQGYIKPGNVKIMIHPPVNTAGLTKEEENALSDKIRNIIIKGHEELMNMD